MYRISLCDGVRVQCGEVEVTKFRTQKAARLLAFLALNPGSHSRDRLIELFWPDLELDAARNGLSYTLLYLRNPLERDLGVPDGSLIHATRSSVGLVSERFTTDLDALPPGFDPERLLPGFYDDWVLQARAALAQSLTPTLQERQPLPSTWTSYLGREVFQQQVSQLLDTSRLLTIVGTGGVGKTRLALETLQSREAEGAVVAWVELAPLTEPEGIAERIVAALGLSGASTLIPTLRKQKLLLCLDNCEHLGATIAREAERLVRSCPQLTILATSREPLGIAGETILRLPCLTEAEAIRLFCDRAQRARPGWQLGPEEGPLLSLLCRRLDCLPLALELAAAKLRLYPLNVIVEQLEARFALLRSNHRIAEPRQQTLYTSIAWSYDLLSECEQRAFAALAVFHGAWTREQAVELWAGEESDVLDALVDKSLVQAEPTANGVRYRFLETIHEFAKAQFAQCSSIDQERWQRAHLEIFYCLLSTLQPELTESEVLRYAARIRSFEDNFVPALEFCRRDQPERALTLCRSLAYYWQSYVQYGRTREQLSLTLQLPESQSTSAELLKDALFELYFACDNIGDWQGASRAVDRLELVYPRPLHLLKAVLARNQHDLERARILMEQAVTYAQTLDNPQFVFQTLRNYAELLMTQGELANARRIIEEAQAFLPTNDDPDFGSLTEVQSKLALLEGNYLEARKLMAQAYLKDRNHRSCAYYLTDFATLARREGNLRESARLHGASIAWCEQNGFTVRGFAAEARAADLAILQKELGEADFQRAFAYGYNGNPPSILDQLIV